jgi:hypothetical protein
MPGFQNFSRRDLLLGTAAGALAMPRLSVAKAPLLNTQVPAYYRFKLGALELTVVSDGPLSIGEPKPEMFAGVTKDEINRLLTENFIPTDNVVLEQNALIVNTWARRKCSEIRPAGCWPTCARPASIRRILTPLR